MKQTNIKLCPKLKTKEDIPSFEGRMFANIAILESRLASLKDQKVPASEVAKLLRMIMEVEDE